MVVAWLESPETFAEYIDISIYTGKKAIDRQAPVTFLKFREKTATIKILDEEILVTSLGCFKRKL